MEHLEGHPHAFLDINNTVIQVAVFDGHDHALLEQVKAHYECADYKCCCDFGVAYINGDFYNGKFYPPKPYPEWVRDEEIGEWVAPEGWVEPAIIE